MLFLQLLVKFLYLYNNKKFLFFCISACNFISNVSQKWPEFDLGYISRFCDKNFIIFWVYWPSVSELHWIYYFFFIRVITETIKLQGEICPRWIVSGSVIKHTQVICRSLIRSSPLDVISPFCIKKITCNPKILT